MAAPHTSEAATEATASSTAKTEGARARVMLPLPLAGAYDYRVPEALAGRVAPGDFVHVPLGRRSEFGVVWDGEAAAELPEAKLKDIIDRLDAPPLPEVSRRFIDWVAAYTLAAPGAVLRMAMSVSDALSPEAARFVCRRSASAPDPAAEPAPKGLTPARRRVLEQLTAGALAIPELARAARCGSTVVRGMIERGWIDLVEERPPPGPDGGRDGPALSPAQTAAAQALCARIGAGYSVTLLDGVTGSGKTEVYFEAVATALRAGRQVVVLLPEIAMSAQWFARFLRRFGAPPALWHSELGHAQRRRTWRAVAEGRAPIVVGARSALFLPFPKLGLIVIDEEHEPAYKQEDGVVYHARDMAVVRARLGSIPAVLVSATPSLETQVNVEAGRYQLLHLPDRHGGATMPLVETIDLRRTPPARNQWLAGPLRQALIENRAAGEQALLFLNRRGYAPLTLCRSCGHRFQCPDCTSWLVEHRLARKLQCHHCGYAIPVPRTCPQCGAADSLAACGPGVERIAEEVQTLLPDARVVLITSDTVGGPAAAQELIRAVEAREIDVVVGTQIVAKGHHFPHLTLVGVVDGDLGLEGGDLRAGERTWQLLHQVAGRAGRAEHPGRVLLQTHWPEHPVMRALVSGERDRFMQAEAADRRRMSLPPFGRLAALVISGGDPDQVDAICRALSAAAPKANGLTVLGPAPAPIAILRGRHRRRFLVKAARDTRIQDWIADWLAKVDVPASVRVQVDIDPYSFM
ncbi:MAG: primosomal protein N' [Alphaproteobacteria bacterium]|nr:primosomal protein N' [Alphaproteobacteria bacterium]